MIKYLTMGLRVVVIAIIYFVIYKIIKIMYMDMKGVKKKEKQKTFALEVMEAPDRSEVMEKKLYPVRNISTIGRGKDNTIILNDPYVSSKHAEVFTEGGRLFLKDLNSTNKTYKNGASVSGIEEIAEGDTIKIGQTLFRIV
jgi:pSer/pThr/pTyr-binding forkhead associated (FHA) protein